MNSTITLIHNIRMISFLCMNMNTWDGSDMLTEPQSKHCWMMYNWIHYGSFQNGTNMSATRDMLNGMYFTLLRCGSFKNGSGMFTETAREVDRSESWCAAWRRTVSMQLHGGMQSHLLYSSLGLQLGYRVICFFQKYVQHTFICFSQTIESTLTLDL